MTTKLHLEAYKLTRRTILRTMVGGSILLKAGASFSKEENASLLEALRAGNLIIYFRHSLTIRAGQPDNDLTSCANQRNLTDAGRSLARDIGQAFKALRIPVGEVLSSPYCRCVDTADLAFGRSKVASFLETNGDPDEAGEKARLAGLAEKLRQPPNVPGNTILVAHGNNLSGLAQHHAYPMVQIDEAEAVIFQPKRTGNAAVLKTVKGSEWHILAS